MDEIDQQLTKLLGQNAWQSSAEIGAALGLGSSTVRRRMRKLLADKTIRILATVDPAKVGFPLTVVIGFDVSPDKVRTVADKLAEYDEVRWVLIPAGRFDILALALFSSTDDLARFMQESIGKINGVIGTETSIILHVGKGRYLPIL